MPVYKGGRNEGLLLIRSLESLLAQTFTDFTVVIVNNDSPDNTEEIVLNTVGHDSRFVYCRNAVNYGYLFSLHRLFMHCTTKYFFIFHFDTYLSPKFVEKCVNALEKDPSAVIAYSYCQFVDEYSNFLELYHDSFPFDQDDPVDRYLGVLSRMGWCTPYHGITRYNIAAKHLFRAARTNNAAFDNEYLALMALEGKLIQINLPLFFRVKDSYQRGGESLEDRYERLYGKHANRQDAIYLPFCNFIKDHCKDIINFDLPLEKKDKLIVDTLNILSKKYHINLNYEIERVIKHIISGDFKHEYFDMNAVPAGKYKFLDLAFLADLSSELAYARILKPSFPRINLAQAFLYMFLGYHKEALFFVEQELLVNPNDKLAQSIKQSLHAKL
jgi:glycosyltransferase involved in cell wall biosynthesis